MPCYLKAGRWFQSRKESKSSGDLRSEIIYLRDHCQGVLTTEQLVLLLKSAIASLHNPVISCEFCIEIYHGTWHIMGHHGTPGQRGYWSLGQEQVKDLVDSRCPGPSMPALCKDESTSRESHRWAKQRIQHRRVAQVMLRSWILLPEDHPMFVGIIGIYIYIYSGNSLQQNGNFVISSM